MESETHIPRPSRIKEFATPIAIIVAGLLIGGAIVLVKGPSSSGGPQVSKQSQAEVAKELSKKAVSLGINEQSFVACTAEATPTRITSHMKQATDAKMQGTPYFLIEFGPFEKPTNVIAVPGALDKELFQQIIRDQKLPATITPVPVPTYVRPTQDDHVRGTLATSSARIIEYGDIDCPFCKKVHPVVASIQQEIPNTAWIYRHYPLTRLHPFALQKAVATECVAQLGGEEAFWKYLDSLQ